MKGKSLVPALLAAGFLLLAISSGWPYSFYVLMRFTVCTIAIYLAHNSFTGRRILWVWILAAVAVLFNPIIPVRMHRSDWSTLDVIAALIFGLWVVASLVQEKRKQKAG